jgi:hypothetical protein
MPLDPKQQDNHVNHEKQHDRYFQDQHPSVDAVVVKQLI